MRKQVSSDELVNWWLDKFHSTSLDKVLEENPEWKDNPQEHTREFYIKYAVTQEQANEWEAWAKEHIKKITKMSKKLIDKGWWSVYLDCSPSVISND